MKIVSMGRDLGDILSVHQCITAEDHTTMVCSISANLTGYFLMELFASSSSRVNDYAMIISSIDTTHFFVRPIRVSRVLFDETIIDSLVHGQDVKFTAHLESISPDIVLTAFTFETLRFIGDNDCMRAVGECLYRVNKDLYGTEIP